MCIASHHMMRGDTDTRKRRKRNLEKETGVDIMRYLYSRPQGREYFWGKGAMEGIRIKQEIVKFLQEIIYIYIYMM